ncbi:hypothetical protein AWE51_02240 [Aquimarina aggregata]|uniref:Outer membrane protein beta-barrel domain-containing protein n=1 Tax=Aquimarina aggregata TaxID=1642818 RepID=A0A163CD16_9FLAO|nr:porin family protein [Aquimarina aggregata]KZS42282.1 hypothetical protein AWE51_02240 [Aquimarina aggregata]
MKKYIYLFFAVFMIVFNVQGQDEDPLYTRAGFKLGLNYSNLTGDIDNADARTRIHLGAVIEFPISQRFYIQTEVLYSAQGFTIDENGEENKISLNYLSLPVLTKFYFTPKFSFETGPRLSTLASSSRSIGDEDTEDEFFEAFNDVDFSWMIGAGYKAESGMFFQLHYGLGLSNVSNIDGINNTNSLLQLSIGYLFKTKNNRRQEPISQ